MTMYLLHYGRHFFSCTLAAPIPLLLTAYSLEDNELWKRHFLRLLVQVGVAFYVFLRSWAGSRISFLAIPIFVPGIIKYGERTWVLRSASSEHFRESLEDYDDQLMKTMIMPKALNGWPHSDNAIFLPIAYSLFQVFERLFADLTLNFIDTDKKASLVTNHESGEDAFKVVEMELGFMYDVLYTKASIVYTRQGCVLRAISFSTTISVFVVFLMIEKHGYSNIDIIITHILLVGAIVLEMYALIVLLSSDWVIVWLCKHQNSLTKLMFRLISSLGLTSNKRWSNSMGQCSLLSFCLKDKSTHGIYKWYRINEMLGKYPYMAVEEVSSDLKVLIFQQLQEKLINSGFGKLVLKEIPDFSDFRWIFHVSFERSVLLWHIATEICYYSDSKESSSKRQVSKWVSDYMVYLQIRRPFMLPKGRILSEGNMSAHGVPDHYKYWSEQISFKDICAEAMRILGRKSKSDKTQACTMSLQVNTDLDRIIGLNCLKKNITKHVLYDGIGLAKSLQLLETEKKWEMMRDVWLEMLYFAAIKCRGKYHAQQLGRGGQLLTHVCILMAHFCITEHIQPLPSKEQDFPRNGAETVERMGAPRDIILWSAYLFADWVATVSLGILANSQGDSNNNDSRDHSLPWRLRYRSRISFLAIPIFVLGMIKYGERTWVLRSASSKHFRESMLNHPIKDLERKYVILWEEYKPKKAEGGDLATEMRPEAPNIGPHSDGTSDKTQACMMLFLATIFWIAILCEKV
ncbi:hypothetical protein HHK36_030396 [Tetracentron sinense]|uniref:DUF4220 domain-containing protein n=1 Tax=Tetracentron sinense TaxID=13715 RepID=A0A834Y9T0_TETSI|nr:hypothetical protein HHK36_030396 [Tetracentron sinense]